jgi:hypothetical protein
MSTEARRRAARLNGLSGGGADRVIDLVGKKFGKWEVIRRGKAKPKDHHAVWLCRCLSGAEREVASNNYAMEEVSVVDVRNLGCVCVPTKPYTTAFAQ